MGTKLTDWPANVQEQIRAAQLRSKPTPETVSSNDYASSTAAAFDEGAHENALTDAGKSEKALQYAAFAWLRDHGATGIVWNRLDRPTTCRVGQSDFVFNLCGRYVAAECKIGKRQPTKQQQEFLDEVNATAGKAFVFRSIAELAANLENKA